MKFSRYVPMSLPRQWIKDLLYFGRKSYVAGGNTIINIAPLAAARRAHKPAISRTALLVKALAVVSSRWPQLRQAYMPWPWPHFYQHPHAVATVVVEREWRGELAVFFDQIQRPEEMSLTRLDRLIHGIKTSPIEGISGFRHIIRLTRFPLPIRRLVWRLALYCSGRLRARFLGTFSVNSITSRRTEFMQSTTPLTLSLVYGVPDLNGDMPIQILIDHRVIDGMATRRVASELQNVLNNEMVAELREEATGPNLADPAVTLTSQGGSSK